MFSSTASLATSYPGANLDRTNLCRCLSDKVSSPNGSAATPFSIFGKQTSRPPPFLSSRRLAQAASQYVTSWIRLVICGTCGSISDRVAHFTVLLERKTLRVTGAAVAHDNRDKLEAKSLVTIFTSCGTCRSDRSSTNSI